MRAIRRLQTTFGAPFLILIVSIYWTQGFRSLAWMSVSYLLKDELQLSPSASQFVLSIAFLPWSVKPVYGLLSDCVPIRGSRRVSYLIISSILSFAPWLLLGIVSHLRVSYAYLTILLTIQNFGAAMADVVIDAMVAEAARTERAEYAGDLQSLSWFSMAFGGMVGSVASGLTLSSLDVKGTFILFSLFPLLQIFTCGWIDEDALISESMQNATLDTDQGETEKGAHELETMERMEGHGFMVEGAGLEGKNLEVGETNVDAPANAGSGRDSHIVEDDDWVEVQNNGLEEIAEDGNNLEKGSAETRKLKDHRDEPDASGETSVAMQYDASELSDFHQEEGLRKRRNVLPREDRTDGADEGEKEKTKQSFGSKVYATCITLFKAIRQPVIMRPMLWFFLAQISIPSLSTIMFYYQTNHLHMDASFLGTARLVGWAALMLGTFLYNRYLKHVRLRKIFWWVQVVLTLLTLSDNILVSGLNLHLKIPSKAFVLGISALGDAINQFKFMPFLILSSRLCEAGIEGTLFALFMSLSNLGSLISSFFGAALAFVLQISADKFDNLAIGIYIQAACTLLPIFFLDLIPSEATGVSANSSD